MHGATGTWLRVVRLVQATARPGYLSKRLQAFRPVLGLWYLGPKPSRLMLGVVRLLLDALILFPHPARMLLHVTIMQL